MSLPLLSGRAADADRDRHRRSRGDAAGDPLLAMEAPGHLDRLLVRDRLDVVDEIEVEHVGLEAGADALDLVRTRLGRLALADRGQHRRGRRLDADEPHRPLLLLLEVAARRP